MIINICMQKISQKELLDEGFLNTIRKITSPIAKTVAGAAGAAKGIAKVVAPNLSQAIGSDINKIKSIGKSASDAFTAEKNKQINSTPERFVENELKTNWTKVFDPASIKVTSKQNAAPMSHKSFRLSKVNKFFIYFEANRYKKQGGVEVFKGNAAISKGSDGKFTLEDIEDNNGNSISNSGSNETLPKLDDLMKKLNFNTTNSTASKWATALKRTFRGGIRDPRKEIDTLIPAAANNDNYVLTTADVDTLRQYLKDEFLISEKNNQKDLLLQLKLLNDSYNKTYELSKH
jgi:hypothetical protein